jgi:hypothetical protein
MADGRTYQSAQEGGDTEEEPWENFDYASLSFTVETKFKNSLSSLDWT